MRRLALLILLCMVAACVAQAPPLPADWVNRIAAGNLLVSNTLNVEYMATIGNGYIATSFGSNTTYVSGVFNGPLVSLDAPTHRARIPSYASVSLSSPSLTMVACGIDLQNATFYVLYTSPSNSSVSVQLMQYAHRVNRSLIVTDISINTPIPLTISLSVNSGGPSPDLSQQVNVSHGFVILTGQTLIPELNNGPLVSVASVSTDVPATISVPAKSKMQHFVYLTAIRTSLDAAPGLTPEQCAMNDYLAAITSDVSALHDTHKAAWATIWNSGVWIEGDLPLAQAVNASLYYIVSSIRDDWAWSLSPGGLASNSYNGHTFWDCETWMYPPLLTFWPSLAASALQYRFNHIPGAQAKAASYTPPYQGTMFPWESAFSGQEACPTSAPTGLYEQHISGDIAFALREYYYATGDRQWLAQVGWPLASGIATFWASRVQFYDGQFVINNVIPPDEYHQGNNSVYTNVVASLALSFAVEAAQLLDQPYPDAWTQIALNMKIPFNTTLQIHPEFDGYTGDMIKQADVVLLGYPLRWPMTPQIRLNDLVYYQNRTDPNGPAMTYGMYAVAWLELGQPSQAAELFNRSYANIKAPFNVWTETPTGGAVNFITGAGGFLQGIINGYGGMRLGNTSLAFTPQLPATATSMTLANVFYQDSTITVHYTRTHSTVALTSGPSLMLTWASGTGQLQMGKPVKVPPGFFQVAALQ